MRAPGRCAAGRRVPRLEAGRAEAAAEASGEADVPRARRAAAAPGRRLRAGQPSADGIRDRVPRPAGASGADTCVPTGGQERARPAPGRPGKRPDRPREGAARRSPRSASASAARTAGERRLRPRLEPLGRRCP